MCPTTEREPPEIDPRLLGERLQEARKARRLTQRQVAELLGLARTTLVAIEQGARRVRPGELVKLAELYGRPVSELVRQGPVVPSFAVQFRAALRPDRGQDTPADTLGDAVESFHRWCDNYVYLESVTGARRPVPEPRFCDISGLSADRGGELVARSERNQLGLGESPIGDLRALLEEERGLRIFLLDLPARISGMFAYSSEHGGCVAINRKHPRERRRWSMAHEYGHFLTSRYEADILPAEGPGSSASDRTSDAFAKYFLLPSEAVARRFDLLLQQGGGQVTPAGLIGLADYFGVSFQAMVPRLEELRRLPAGTWQRLSEQGFRVREAQAILAYPREAPSEEPFPRRYLLLAVWAFAQERISEGQLAAFLGVDRLGARERVRKALEDTGASDLESLSRLLSGSIL